DAASAALRTDDGEPGETYVNRLRAGATYLLGDRLLLAIAVSGALTNLVDAGWGTVLLPVWAKQTGGGPAAIAALGVTFGGAAIVGSALATAWADRLPRRWTLL